MSTWPTSYEEFVQERPLVEVEFGDSTADSRGLGNFFESHVLVNASQRVIVLELIRLISSLSNISY